MAASSTATDGSGATLRDHIADAAKRLGNRREADLLAGLALERPLSWIYAHDDEPTDPEILLRYADFVQRRSEGVPFAYLAGRQEFFGREFSVSPAALIPRPETEHLVEWTLALGLPERARLVDIGTGSGCILLTLACERPHWSCTGTDISREALAVAEINRVRLGAGNVELVHGGLFEPVAGRSLDLIVSNPPYVAAGDPHLEQGDVRYEPAVALTPGPDGLAVIRSLISDAPARLTAGGWLLIEHGHDQAAAVRKLFEERGFSDIESRRDLAGIERVTGGKWGERD
ncbi:MAG: peptide chain release factor N(5)-glutamine methyltransferase [Candidatus Wenzhouxiangella sp. M2_3B_020]